MQADIHPVMNPVIFRDAGAGKDFFGFSTTTSDQTEDIDGVTYYVIVLDVSSASHPFYTGKQNLLDTSGRVERFKRMQEQAAQVVAA
jgi:large subunit ribosomal protein L31